MSALARIWDQYQEKRLTKKVLPYTLVGPERMHNLYLLAHRIEDEGIPGDVVECGVYKGGTAAILASVATHSKMRRTVWLFDSLQGMPPTTEPDGEAATEWVGELSTSPDAVLSVLRLAGANLDRVRIVPGLFQDTFSSVHIPQIALLN